MTNKMPKSAYQILLGFLILTFTVVACNSKKEEDKKETPTETTVKPADVTPPSTGYSTGKKDSIVEKPVKTTD